MNDNKCLAGGVATQQRYLPCPQGVLRDPQGVLAEGTLRGREGTGRGGNGNITSLVDIYNGQTETLVYDYDAINRLKAVSNALSESYEYNDKGNLEIKGGQTLYYDAAAHKHAATSYNGNTYAYDANGNMTTRVVNGVTTTLNYDAENRLVGATWQNHTAQFIYDGDGRRVKSVVDGTAIDYVGAHYEVKGSVVTKYYFAGGQVVALRQGGVLSYLFSDHLGSTTVTTDSSATKTAEMRYKPWGETRYTSGTTPTDRHYTGQYEESGIGLYFYNARWYDPLLGRFAQADTLIPQPGSPLAWDRYGYVMNNPVKYNDPTGHCIGPLLYFCILGGLYVADHIAIIGAVALTGAVLSYVGNSAPDMELVNDKAASQVEFENRTAQSQAWLLLYGGARIVADITSPPATTALSKETSANPVTPRSETSNYTKVEYQGRNIYQRNDIDWDYIDPKRGFTNRELAANGNAPC